MGEIENKFIIKVFMYSGLEFILFVFIGMIGGFLGGLLGVGGGVVSVPCLYYFFLYKGNYTDYPMQTAVATSLAAAVVTSGVSLYFQMKSKAVHFYVIKWISPTLVIGCIAGAVTAHYVHSHFLSTCFAILASILGIYFAIPRLPHLHIASKPNASLSLFSLGIGVLSSMLGIGGGVLSFPLLLGYNISVKEASGTSSAATLLATIVGSLSYLFVAGNFPGYIDLPIWATVTVGTLMTVRLGVKCVHLLPISLIKRIFGWCLIAIAISMFFIG